MESGVQGAFRIRTFEYLITNTDRRTAGGLAALYQEHIRGKTVLVTGVSPGGIGAAFVLGISSARPAALILAGRDATKVKATADAIPKEYSIDVRTLKLDLADLGCVRASSETVNGWADVPRIDVLVNNAGVMGTDWAATPEGYDAQFVTNHLGPFLFTNLVMGKLLKSSAPRIINVTSDGHRLSPVRFEDWNFRDGAFYNKWLSYGQSKTANMLMTISLAEKLGTKHNLYAFSVHPGLVVSNLGNHLKLYGEDNADWRSMNEIDRIMGNAIGWVDLTEMNIVPDPTDVGANTPVFAAFDPKLTDHNGSYLQSCRLSDPWKDTFRPWAASPVEAEKLWRLSEKLVGQEFSY